MAIWLAIAQAGMQLTQGEAAKWQAEAEGKVAGNMALADESTIRRRNRDMRGFNAAALAESGLTPDGSSGIVADQSAAEAEMDALNTRYQGQLRRLGLMNEGRQARSNSRMLAGGRLLTGFADAYTGGRRRIPGGGSGLIGKQTSTTNYGASAAASGVS
jgi:hypothetical protein